MLFNVFAINLEFVAFGGDLWRDIGFGNFE